MSGALEPDPTCPSCLALAAELKALRKVVDKLSGDVERLKARKPQTSRTSRRPSDAPWSKQRAVTKSSGKKRGAQPGHETKPRAKAPPEDVNDAQSGSPAT